MSFPAKLETIDAKAFTYQFCKTLLLSDTRRFDRYFNRTNYLYTCYSFILVIIIRAGKRPQGPAGR